MIKVVLITENLKPPYDEGIKKSVYYIYRELNKHYDTYVICRKGFENDKVYIIKTNKLLLSKQIKNILNRIKPEIIVYLPFSSNTFASHLRTFILRKLYPKAKTIFIILQPKHYKKWNKVFLKYLKPDVLLSTSIKLIRQMEILNVHSKLILPYTDLSKFKLISKEKRIELRKKYNLPINKFIISHIGHINWGRNLDSLIPLQSGNNQVVIVGSSSTPLDAPKEENLKNRLINSGIIVLDGYIESIQEIYQLSDCIFFR